MTQVDSNTNSHKGKHLTFDERSQITVLKKEGYSNRAIARVLKRSHQAINDEIKRGMVTQLRIQKQNGKTYKYYEEIYDHKVGQGTYDHNRLNSGRRPKWADTDAFVDWADNKMLNDKWSPDTVVNTAIEDELFHLSIIPSTTTLYNWIDRGIMKTKNMDLLEKTTRNTKNKQPKTNENKRILGRSIDERPQAVEAREEFGHWEIDTVIGHKNDYSAPTGPPIAISSPPVHTSGPPFHGSNPLLVPRLCIVYLEVSLLLNIHKGGYFFLVRKIPVKLVMKYRNQGLSRNIIALNTKTQKVGKTSVSEVFKRAEEL